MPDDAMTDSDSRKRLLPPAFLGAGVLLMVALHVVLPAWRVIPWPFNCTGALLIVAGGVLNVWADRLFKVRRTTVKPFAPPAALVTHGPYRLSRHPMYLGMAAAVLGLAVILGTATPFLVVPIFVWVLAAKFIPAEERAMERTFGQAYRDYRQRVRRWL